MSTLPLYQTIRVKSQAVFFLQYFVFQKRVFQKYEIRTLEKQYLVTSFKLTPIIVLDGPIQKLLLAVWSIKITITVLELILTC